MCSLPQQTLLDVLSIIYQVKGNGFIGKFAVSKLRIRSAAQVVQISVSSACAHWNRRTCMEKILITHMNGEKVAEIEGRAEDTGAIDVLANSPWRFVVSRNHYYNVGTAEESWYCRWNGKHYLGVPRVVHNHTVCLCEHGRFAVGNPEYKCSMCKHIYDYGIEVLVYGRSFGECVSLFDAVVKGIVVRAA